MLRVPSSNDVSVAVHELAGTDGPDHPILLVAHATGFHGRAYLPLAHHLAPPFHVFGMDSRGHGDTEAPPDWTVDWRRYGDDASAVADHLAGRPGGQDGLIGFGHSKGGADLLMAASRDPAWFRLLVLFEPIVFPVDGPTNGPGSLAAGARRRRATFPSIDEAIATYGSKPPLDAFDPDALDAYVRYGFKPDPDGVRLKCDPEIEAGTFELGAEHHTWELLAGIETPVVVVAGQVEPMGPASIAEAVAHQLPHGRFVLDEALDHFGPFTNPAHVAALITSAVDVLTAEDRN